MWDSMLKVRAGQIQPTGGPQHLLWTCLRAALVYTYIKSRGVLNSPQGCYLQTVSFVKSTAE